MFKKISFSKKIASMLNNIANFGVVNCFEDSQKICKEYRTSVFALYPVKQFSKSKEKV